MNIEPLVNEVEVTGKNVQVAVSFIGEGLCGDYSEDDPNDIPLLRMDVMRKGGDGAEEADDGEWGNVRNGSFCTQIDARISEGGARDVAQAAVDLLDPLPGNPGSVELLSWAESAADIRAKFAAVIQGNYSYLTQR